MSVCLSLLEWYKIALGNFCDTLGVASIQGTVWIAWSADWIENSLDFADSKSAVTAIMRSDVKVCLVKCHQCFRCPVPFPC